MAPSGGGCVKVNRANARRSAGPRSAAGKARSAGNALRHGLAAPVGGDATLAPGIARLALRLLGAGAGEGVSKGGEQVDAALRALAESAAEAQVDLARIRRTRRRLLAALEAALAPESEGETTGQQQQPDPAAVAARAHQAAIDAAIVKLAPGLKRLVAWRNPSPAQATRRLIDDLARLERYERRAFSRRKRAFRALSELLPEPVLP